MAFLCIQFRYSASSKSVTSFSWSASPPHFAIKNALYSSVPRLPITLFRPLDLRDCWTIQFNTLASFYHQFLPSVLDNWVFSLVHFREHINMTATSFSYHPSDESQNPVITSLSTMVPSSNTNSETFNRLYIPSEGLKFTENHLNGKGFGSPAFSPDPNPFSSYHLPSTVPTLPPTVQSNLHFSAKGQPKLPPPSLNTSTFQMPTSTNSRLTPSPALPLLARSFLPQSTLTCSAAPTTTFDLWNSCESPVTPHIRPVPVYPTSGTPIEVPPSTAQTSILRQAEFSLPPPPLQPHQIHNLKQSLNRSSHVRLNTEHQTNSHRPLLPNPLEDAFAPARHRSRGKLENDLILEYSKFPSNQSHCGERQSVLQSNTEAVSIRNSGSGCLGSPNRFPLNHNTDTCFSQNQKMPEVSSVLCGNGLLAGDLSKPINTLGSLCFTGFYLVTLTRTLIRNRTVPHAVRKVFMAPQLHFGFTIRDKRDGKWRHVHTVQIPYEALTAAGEWLRVRLGLTVENATFKGMKDALQKSVTSAWAEGTWGKLVDRLGTDFGPVIDSQADSALDCDSVASISCGTPRQYFNQINCHKGAPDIRKDVDGAISAREALRWTLSQLGLTPTGSNIPIGKFRDEIYPLWRSQCSYVRDHGFLHCCSFYGGGYFKKIMVHKNLYSIDQCTSSYHVKDIFEGLEEVIKVWSNPTGMCVREAKCAAGLRYNVDKSFQSGIRSYAKAKFLEAAPHTAREFLAFERELHQRVQRTAQMKARKFPKCGKALQELELASGRAERRTPPDVLLNSEINFPPVAVKLGGEHNYYPREILTTTEYSPCARKRRRSDQDHVRDYEVEREREREQERDHMLGGAATPREQKRMHAHLSLKRKEAAEVQVREYLEMLREDCQRQQDLLDRVKQHGHNCHCLEYLTGELNTGGNSFCPTTVNWSGRG